MAAIIGFLFQHLEEDGQRIAVAGGGETVHRLGSHGGQLELVGIRGLESITASGEPSVVTEGSGANAMVHLLFELAREERATVLTEEPEIHLPPGT